MLRGVLRQIDARRVPGDPPRRWYMSVDCDLIVWIHDDETPMGFQFCYGKREIERALTWMPRDGYRHQMVDKTASGDAVPLLVPDGCVDPRRLLEIFREEAPLVPDLYVAFVSEKIRALMVGNMAPSHPPRVGDEGIR